ncbi:putative mitochondrial protein [Vitis vinifera]|uniref:Putative mitochondrial protein n=1 Tax=Vitis vinifera TaxID=29760 RepID=A0A438I9U8_VITVI|nr:putative mitochondrial protein [Vitis vinifera]
MVLTLIGLRLDLEFVRDQILASPSLPSLDDVFARLLRLSSTQTLSTDGPSDSSVLASQTNSRGGRSDNRGRGQRPQCTYCNKLGHTRDHCYQLHGRPPHTAHIAQSSDPLLSRPDSAASSTSQSITLTSSDYDVYLRYQAATSASVAQTGNVSVCFTQIYGCDYSDTFSPVAKIAFVRLFLSMAAMCHWPLYQLDIKNAFLHGELLEEVYMEQPPGFVAQGESVIRRVTKDLGKLKYFLRLEIAQSNSGVVMSQRKYALDILEETGMLECKPVDTPMDPNVKLVPGQGEPLRDPGRYRRLVGKLNYLTITRPDISFPVSVVSQFLQSPCDNHWDAVIRILRYIKGAPDQGMLYEDMGHTQIVGYTDADWAGSPSARRSTSGYCVFIGGNLISWKSKKTRCSGQIKRRS